MELITICLIVSAALAYVFAPRKPPARGATYITDEDYRPLPGTCHESGDGCRSARDERYEEQYDPTVKALYYQLLEDGDVADFDEQEYYQSFIDSSQPDGEELPRYLEKPHPSDDIPF